MGTKFYFLIKFYGPGTRSDTAAGAFTSARLMVVNHLHVTMYHFYLLRLVFYDKETFCFEIK